MSQPQIKTDIEARVKDTGDVMTGNLEIQTSSVPNLILYCKGSSSWGNIYKNSSSTVEDGLHLVDTAPGGNNSKRIIIKAANDLNNAIYLHDRTQSYPILYTGNVFSQLDGRYINAAGDTMTGNLNFANGTWNLVGDDCFFGDNNVAGAFCIKGNNGDTQLRFIQHGGTNFASITYNGTNTLTSNTDIRVQKASPNLQLYHSGNARLGQWYIDDSKNLLLLNWGGANDFTQLGIINETIGTNDILHCYRKTSSTSLEDYIVLHTGNYFNYVATNGIVGTDFNSLTRSGMYRFNTSSSHANMPPLSWGQCLVVHGAGDTIAQVAFDFAGPNVYLRVGNPPECGGSGVWHDWGRMWCEGNSVTGAVWNDYAEYREADTIEPGYVLIEIGNDTLTKSTERLQSYAGVSSDTWGFSQGETDRAKTPIAVAGRVLVYPFQERENYKPGQCVCAAPGGTVDIMTEEEIVRHPDRIVGTVSCVPTYDTWGGGPNADRPEVAVNGRIWIKVK